MVFATRSQSDVIACIGPRSPAVAVSHMLGQYSSYIGAVRCAVSSVCSIDHKPVVIDDIMPMQPNIRLAVRQ